MLESVKDPEAIRLERAEQRRKRNMQLLLDKRRAGADIELPPLPQPQSTSDLLFTVSQLIVLILIVIPIGVLVFTNK